MHNFIDEMAHWQLFVPTLISWSRCDKKLFWFIFSVLYIQSNFFVWMAACFVSGNVPFALEIHSALTRAVFVFEKAETYKILNENVINHFMGIEKKDNY